MIDWNKYYESYQVNKELIWLNNCGTTPVGNFAKQKVIEYLEGYSKAGVFTEVEKYISVKKTITSIIAKLINSSEEEIGLIHNTSEGMNFIARELELKEEDEILLLENEYPSNVYPFEFWKNYSVKIKFIPMADTQEEFYSNFLNSLTSKTKAVSLSLVHWCTGMPLPIEQIGKTCKERNIKLIIDGAQGVGLVKVDVASFNIDYMAFPAWKWLLGPLGLGVIFVSKKNLEKTIPVFKGQNSVTNADEYLPYKSEWKQGADRYEYSTSSMTDWVYFQATLKMLDSIGFEIVQNRIYELSNYLTQKLKQIGFEMKSQNFSNLNTGILSAYKKDISMQDLQVKLKQNKVISALRLGRLRFAPHIYNSFEQLDKVSEILK